MKFLTNLRDLQLSSVKITFPPMERKYPNWSNTLI